MSSGVSCKKMKTIETNCNLPFGAKYGYFQNGGVVMSHNPAQGNRYVGRYREFKWFDYSVGIFKCVFGPHNIDYMM